jgi:hypothetical protein
MKLTESKITIITNDEGVEIQLRDRTSNTCFAVVKMTPAQFTAALGGLGYTECETEVFGLDKVGKKHENKEFDFIIPEELSTSSKKEELHQLALLHCPDGWTPDKYYGSKTSFFRKNGIAFARTTIRRWI